MKNAVKSVWKAEPPFGGEVAVTITYLYEDASLDVDNMPKPILDALKGLVYSDDRLVSDLLCRKRDLSGALRIQNPSSMLLQAARGSQEFVHIAIKDALNQEGMARWET